MKIRELDFISPINILGISILELQNNLNKIIRDKYNENYPFIDRNFIYKILDEYIENEHHLIKRIGGYFELYVDTNDEDIELYITGDCFTGKNRKNFKLYLNLRVQVEKFKPTKNFEEDFTIIKDGYSNYLEISVTEDLDKSFNEISSMVKTSNNHINNDYIEELNFNKTQALVNYYLFRLKDTDVKDKIYKVLGEEMGYKFYNQPFKGEVSNYLANNILKLIE